MRSTSPERNINPCEFDDLKVTPTSSIYVCTSDQGTHVSMYPAGLKQKEEEEFRLASLAAVLVYMAPVTIVLMLCAIAAPTCSNQ